VLRPRTSPAATVSRCNFSSSASLRNADAPNPKITEIVDKIAALNLLETASLVKELKVDIAELFVVNGLGTLIVNVEGSSTLKQQKTNI
jgi:hypothetical protein